MNIGLVPNSYRAQAVDLCGRIGRALLSEGHAVLVPRSEAGPAGLPEWAVDDDQFSRDLDLVVTLGGDGTVLRAVWLTATRRVPLLAVNLGRLGYLAEVEPEHAEQAIHRFFAGAHRVETRHTVEATLPSGACRGGLNEAVLSGSEVGRMADITLVVNGVEFMSYRCDALIVATATGSTAYALSAGGPIVSPLLDSLIVVPVAAHSLFNRPLVLPPDDALAVRLGGEQHGWVAVDGHKLGDLGAGETLTLVGGDDVPFVRFDGLDFLGILRRKFRLSTPAPEYGRTAPD